LREEVCFCVLWLLWAVRGGGELVAVRKKNGEKGESCLQQARVQWEARKEMRKSKSRTKKKKRLSVGTVVLKETAIQKGGGDIWYFNKEHPEQNLIAGRTNLNNFVELWRTVQNSQAGKGWLTPKSDRRKERKRKNQALKEGGDSTQGKRGRASLIRYVRWGMGGRSLF